MKGAYSIDLLPDDLRGAIERIWPIWAQLAIPPGTLGVILGSGLGAAADAFPRIWERRFAEMGLPEASVAGHEGRLLLAQGAGAPFLFLQGRLHRYEGLPDAQVLLPAAAMIRLGLAALLVTNAAGGLDPAYRAGDFMLIRDILSLQFDDPLRGPGPSPALRDPLPRPLFDAACRAEWLAAAREVSVKVHEGVLNVAPGPAYETPAELALVRAAGAQAASMSTFPECVLAVRLGIPLLAVSCITNKIKEIDQEPVGHEEVVEVGRRASADFARLLAAWSKHRADAPK